jgi:regulator of CtrA degradation
LRLDGLASWRGAGAQAAVPADRLAVTAEQWRLTSRLLDLLAWLMDRRAALAGEPGGGGTLRLDGLASWRGAGAQAAVPADLRDLIDRSLRLHDRVRRIAVLAAQREGRAPAPSEPRSGRNRRRAALAVPPRGVDRRTRDDRRRSWE